MRGNRYRENLLAKFSPHLWSFSPSETFAHLQANEQEEFQILEMEPKLGSWETSYFRNQLGLG